MRRLVRVIVIPVALIAALAVVSMPYVDALAFIARAASMPGAAQTLAEWRAEPFVTEPVQKIPTRHGAIDARLYRPANGRSRRPVTLVPGVHMDGIREARLVGMAEDLAASGFTVLTVASPDLQRFRITPESTDIIEDAAAWLAAGAGGAAARADDGKVGMLGISFSGGLSIVAAGRPQLRDKVSYVMSFGGHGDLQRVMQYLCSGNAPAMPPLGEAADDVAGAEHVAIRPPHDYGVAVVLLGVADQLVPADQVEPLRQGILTFLAASSLDVLDKPRAEIEFQRARDAAARLPEPSHTLLTHVNDRAVDKLGPILMPAVESLAARDEHTSLSPERARAPAAPVYLLHGAEDNVIPSVETVLLTKYLRDKTDVHAVLSGLITHAEVDRSAAAIEVWRLVGFWRSLMAQ
ncbi:MAG TPA: CocE/NonD family hydrolase [Vicinamibacterales bacterium]|nr:CocE/NonD family hydrolase [Vicinamibacterales bacterium]